MPKESSTKFISRNRAPRVHIHYEVEKNGAMVKEELPFIMGVMSDLSGDTKDPKDLAKRDFTEFDVDNFDKKMKAMKPSAKFTVPNVLTDDGGNLSVNITFENMDDFSPAAVARKVGALNKLLETRTELSNLLSLADGREKAEELISRVLKDRKLQEQLAGDATATTPDSKK